MSNSYSICCTREEIRRPLRYKPDAAWFSVLKEDHESMNGGNSGSEVNEGIMGKCPLWQAMDKMLTAGSNSSQHPSCVPHSV